METALILSIVALCASLGCVLLCAQCAKRVKNDSAHAVIQKLQQEHQNLIDEFIDFRDMARKWMKRDQMREARAAKAKHNGADTEADTPSSHQDVKSNLRRILAAQELDS